MPSSAASAVTSAARSFSAAGALPIATEVHPLTRPPPHTANFSPGGMKSTTSAVASASVNVISLLPVSAL